MSTPDPNLTDERLQAIEASYQRQLSLAGKPGYDPRLTVQLKADFEWLLEQRRKISKEQTDSANS
ncbi:MAG TPA: hypothetical protein VGQ53_18810 [Chitinophagaceae bacterium]|jgi:hypothetical protein|nr:hypothetical protein [Chitinophagaceae bacterium]